MLLRVKNVTKSFKGLIALNDVSFEVEENALLGIIGPNGAGKTTLFNVMTGIYDPDSGEVLFKGDRISGLRPHQIARKGIGRTFQISRIFLDMTLLENMITPTLYRRNWNKEEIEKRAIELLNSVGLKYINNLGRELSVGQQKLLEFVRVLMQDPEVILMDEPFVGVNPAIKMKLSEQILKLHKEGKTFIIISHDIPSITEICERVIVMSSGRIVAEGSPEEIVEDPRVIEAYLGA